MICRSLLAITVILLPQIGVNANDIPTELEFQQVNPTNNDITVDGDLSEWVGAEPLVDPVFFTPKGAGAGGDPVVFEPHDGGSWDGPEDFSSSLQFLYDEDNLYLGIVVTDEYHENAAASGWNGDAIQLHVANADRDSQVALYNFALPGAEADPDFFPICGPDVEPCIVNEEAGPGGIDAAIIRNNSETPTTTTYEIRLSKESLGLDDGLIPNVSFGLGMAINDGDFDDPGQKGWGGLGAHAVVFGKSPEETAAFFLGEETSTEIPGDANGDGKVNAQDLNVVGGNWQMAVDPPGAANGDFDGNGFVDAADLNVLGNNWQFGVAAPLNAAVPEPAGFQLGLLGLLSVIALRRRRVK